MAKRSGYVLVTGGAGFIGFHCVRHLLETNKPTLVLDNLDPFYCPSYKQKNIDDLIQVGRAKQTDFQFIKMDIRDHFDQALAPYSVDSVIHLAARPGVLPSFKDPKSYFSINVFGTHQILEFCRRRAIKKVIFASSSSVYGKESCPPFKEIESCFNQISPYAMTKRAGEVLCQSYAQTAKLRIAILRFFTVYGPRQRPDLAVSKFADKIFTGQTLHLHNEGKNSRDFTHVDDICAGIMTALDWLNQDRINSCEVFNLGSNMPVEINTLVELMERMIGKKAVVKRIPRQPGEMSCTHADLSKSRRALGFQPNTEFSAGLLDYVKWFALNRESGANKIAGA